MEISSERTNYSWVNVICSTNEVTMRYSVYKKEMIDMAIKMLCVVDDLMMESDYDTEVLEERIIEVIEALEDI